MFSRYTISVFLFFVCALIGCDPPSKNTHDAYNDEAYAIQSDRDLTGIKIGYCTPSLNTPYYNALLTTIKNYVESTGMTFLSADGQNDIIRQISAVEDLITKGVDVLLLNPLDPKALAGVTKSATAAGIPVFIVDSSIDPSADFVTTIQSNNSRNGELAGEWLAEKMGTGGMQIGLLSGSQGNPVGLERRQGLIRGITEYQLRNHGQVQLEIVGQGYTNWTSEGGLKAMEDMIVAHPEINVVMTEGDVMALGALKALERAGKIDQTVIVAAADGQKEAIKLIMEGGVYGVSAMNSPMVIGRMAVEHAVQYLNGKKDFPAYSYTPELLITIDNAKQYYREDALF